jgi:flagellar hook assembly protein FlgD
MGAHPVVLQQNYPNPFNPSTTMVYIVPEHGLVTVAIYDVNGATVATLVQRDHDPGSYSVRWNGRSQSGEVMPSGVYFARVSHNGTVRNRKIVLLK